MWWRNTLAVVLALAFVAGPAHGNVLVHPLPELTNGSLTIDDNPPTIVPVSLGAAFSHIDSITLSIAGDFSTHSWLSCDVNFGCGSTVYTFDDWGVNLYKPGFAGSAVGYFHASSHTSRTIALDDLGGSNPWQNLQSGELQFVLYPLAEGIFVGTHYWSLISSPVVNLNTAMLTFVGDYTALPMPDYNHNGVVDTADYTVWRDGLGSTYSVADYGRWKANFGQNASGAGSMGVGSAQSAAPEPTAWLLAVGTLLGGVHCNARWPRHSQ